MCGIEPSNLAAELPDLKIGRDSVSWYQAEIDRFHELASKFMEDSSTHETTEAGGDGQFKTAEYMKLLIEFSSPFLQVEHSD